MKTLEEILKYRNYQKLLNSVDYKNIENNFNPNVYLFQKWAYRIPRGWYGFSLDGAPFVWAQIIDDFLEELEKDFPNFEIQQIKLKFGGLRCYVKLNSNDIGAAREEKAYKEIDKLENLLFSENLVY